MTEITGKLKLHNVTPAEEVPELQDGDRVTVSGTGTVTAAGQDSKGELIGFRINWDDGCDFPGWVPPAFVTLEEHHD